MREIKFRAWDRYFTKMVGWKHLIEQCDIDYLFGNYLLPDEEKRTTVPNFAVMQYTGLKDKNGKEIYEGDIYHQGDKKITYTVVWHDTGLIGKQNGASSYAGLNHWQDRIEIIGNIYENPEL